MKDFLLNATFIQEGKVFFIILFIIIIILMLTITYKIDCLPKKQKRKRNTIVNKNADENIKVDDYVEENEENISGMEDLFIANKEENNELPDVDFTGDNIEENEKTSESNEIEEMTNETDSEDEDIDIYEYDKSLYEDSGEESFEISKASDDKENTDDTDSKKDVSIKKKTTVEKATSSKKEKTTKKED